MSMARNLGLWATGVVAIALAWCVAWPSPRHRAADREGSVTAPSVRPSETPPRAIVGAGGRSADLVARLRRSVAQGASADEIIALLREIAVGDPTSALELAIASARNDDEIARWAAVLLRDWAHADPQASWDWLSRHAGRLSVTDGSLLRVVFGEMAVHSPAMVVKNADVYLATAHDPGAPAAQIVAQSAIAELLSHGAADEACVVVEFWAHSPLAPEIGVGTFVDVARELAQSAPSSGLAWLAALPASPERNIALGTLAAEAVAREPEQTMAWASALKPQDGRSEVQQRVFSEWTERNPADTSQWLSARIEHNLRDGDTDAMIVQLVNTSPTVQSDPSVALGWLNLMTDAAQRQAASDQMILRWAARDSAAAISYIQGDGTMDSAHRSQLLQKIGSNSGPWFATDAFGR